MKKIFINLLVICSSMNVYAVNLSQLHEVNFKASGNYCGIHVEVSDNQLIISEIAPPKVEYDTYRMCRSEYSDNVRHCRLQTQIVNCDKHGRCKSIDDGELLYIVSKNGNLVYVPQSIKYIQTYLEEYYWCQ